MPDRGIVIMGVFVADLAFHANRLPNMGETMIGAQFGMGPGGKGSNQAVAAGRAGKAPVEFIAKLGNDTFGDMAKKQWQEANVTPRVVSSDLPTGAAMIFVDQQSKNNAIIIVPGSGGDLSVSDLDQYEGVIGASSVFMTQLEQPQDTALRALEIAHAAGSVTVFNPAPAPEPIDDAFFPLCDYITPNESEAEGLTGIKVASVDDAKRAGDALLAKGAKVALLTLGEQGALYHSTDKSELVPSLSAGEVVDTTGAGDAFNGGFAVALAEGKRDVEAVRFACATASISVTRRGTAPSMPKRGEILALLGE